MPPRTAARLLLIAAALLGASLSAEAQTFNAGARSLGLGGSYQALADDVTAVFWNPAGAANLGIQLHTTFGTYQRIDERGVKDTEPVPGPAFVGATYGLDDDTAIMGGYFTPFVNERRYETFTNLPSRLSFREMRVEQFYNRLSAGAARVFHLREGDWLPKLAIGGTADMSITSVDGDYFDSSATRDQLDAREFAFGFTVGVLVSLVERDALDFKIGGVYHHPGDFDLGDVGFDPLDRSATASRLYDWPLIAGGGVALRVLEDKTLVFVADYQYIGWEDANRFLEDAHNVSAGVEYSIFISDEVQLVLRGGARRLEEPSARDPLSRGIDDHVVNATLGLGFAYQPRVDAFYAASSAIEFGDGFNIALSFTIAF